MSPAEAESYHAAQIRSFKEAGVDMVAAITMTNASEAVERGARGEWRFPSRSKRTAACRDVRVAFQQVAVLAPELHGISIVVEVPAPH
jgi:hypothetical protein